LNRNRTVLVRKDPNSWAITFGDMMSLLLTFFVLIVSFSSLQESKFAQAAASLKQAFGVLARPESVIELNEPVVPNHAPREPAPEFLYEVRSVQQAFISENLAQQVEVEVREDGAVFRLTAPFLFASGEADLREQAWPALDHLLTLFRKFPGEVLVEGHTDDVPISSPRFPSNWELSAARAVAVARYFQGNGLPASRLAATGYGEYRPLASNDDASGRARNRRVEILLRWRGAEQPRAEDLPLFDEAGPALEGRAIVDPVTSRLGRIVGADGN
jgi:chemotaxis protein MotB